MVEPPPEAASVERPTEAELRFAGDAQMFAAFGDFVIAVDPGGIGEGPDGVTIDPAEARMLDLRDGSVTDVDLPGTGLITPLALHGDISSAVIVIVDCPVEPTGQNQACGEPSYESYRLTDPTSGWAELDLGLDTISGEPIGVTAMTTSPDGPAMVIRAQDGDRTFGVLVILEGDGWRGRNGIPDPGTDACSTDAFTYRIVRDAPDDAGTVQPVLVERLGGTRSILTIDLPPVAEPFGVPAVAVGCERHGLVLVSGRVGEEPPQVFEFLDGLGEWNERPDLVGGETLGFPPIRSAPDGVLLTWTDVARSGEPFPTSFTITARLDDTSVDTEVPFDAVVVERPSDRDLVLLPGPPCDEPESCPDPGLRLTEVKTIDPYA